MSLYPDGELGYVIQGCLLHSNLATSVADAKGSVSFVYVCVCVLARLCAANSICPSSRHLKDIRS